MIAIPRKESGSRRPAEELAMHAPELETELRAAHERRRCVLPAVRSGVDSPVRTEPAGTKLPFVDLV